MATVRDAATAWRTHLILDLHGAPKAFLANAITAFRHAPEWRGVLAYDGFSLKTVATAPPPWEAGCNDWRERNWTPHDDALATNWCQHSGMSVGRDVAQAAIDVVARDRSFHPIRDYLHDLEWDRHPRLGTWTSAFLGAAGTPYTSEVGIKFLLSAVARVMQPGCKVDSVPILEGPQGVGKSSALRALFGPWFTDEIADLGSKDAALQTQGAWLIELAELDSLHRAEISKIKAFLSRTTDRFRPPYERRVIENPRQCVFAGTTNSEAYLKDETGGRRFWPIRVREIDLDGLGAARDQLWAEAVAMFQSGRSWWLDEPELAQAAREAQGDRYAADPWHDAVAAFITERRDVSVSEILSDALHIEKSKWTQLDQTRVARCLRVLGLERYQCRTGEVRTWRYRREILVVTSDENR